MGKSSVTQTKPFTQTQHRDIQGMPLLTRSRKDNFITPQHLFNAPPTHARTRARNAKPHAQIHALHTPCHSSTHSPPNLRYSHSATTLPRSQPITFTHSQSLHFLLTSLTWPVVEDYGSDSRIRHHIPGNHAFWLENAGPNTPFQIHDLHISSKQQLHASCVRASRFAVDKACFWSQLRRFYFMTMPQQLISFIS